MWALKALLLGGCAVGALAYVVIALLALAAQAGGRTLDVALGPLLLVAVGEEQGATVTTFGPGIVLVALAGGLANVAAARVLRRRSKNRGNAASKSIV
jgi:predicted outer membrane protein